MTDTCELFRGRAKLTADGVWKDNAMTDTCEWNPSQNRNAQYGDAITGGCIGVATVSVGRIKSWHLCAYCASLPRFKRFRVRKQLNNQWRAK